MNPIRELFVSYSRVDDETPVLRLVEDRDILDVIKNGAPLFKRVGSIINVDSIYETDPLVTIACITSSNLRPDEPHSIAQEVVDWLKAIGEWWT